MTKKRKICVITGTRAEYGLLYWLMKEINESKELELQIVVTGMHLSPEFGLTYQQLEKDGFQIDFKVDMLLSSDSSVATSKSMGLGIIGFADAFAILKPDLLVVLGDRFEIFSAVSAAMIARIPVAHLHGGETTECMVDESIRHSITKMSHLHFTSTKTYHDRVLQLGEQPERVFNVGAVGLDNIKRLSLLTREQLETSLDFKLGKRNLLVTFHPVTLEDSTSKKQFSELLAALDELEQVNIIFTKANADTGGRIINQMIDEYVSKHADTSSAYSSLGQLRYLSAIQYVDGIVGNSSSGIIEVPSFKKGTINIGDRQKGRIVSDSVIHCKPFLSDIRNALQKLFSDEFTGLLNNVVNLYGDGDVTEKIIKILREYPLENIIKKHFYDMKF